MGLEQIQVELQEFMGGDTSIANSAWTSSYDKTKRDERYNDPVKVEALVKTLIEQGHGTPVESVVLRFWIRCPIFVDRQIMTYRIASHNGLSGRYRTLPDDHYTLPSDVGLILRKCQVVHTRYDQFCNSAMEAYEELLVTLKNHQHEGIIDNVEYKRAREVLRGMCPTAGMVERTTVINLRSLANFLKQRLAKDAQPEIQQVAKLMLKAVEDAGVAPVAVATLKASGWVI